MVTTTEEQVERRLETVGKVGYAVTGVLHVLIGAIAVRVALGVSAGGTSADQDGALAQVAAQPFGRVALWAAVVALAVLGFWQLWQSVLAWRTDRRAPASDPGERGTDAPQGLRSAAKGVVYLAIAATTSTYARGGSSSGEQTSTDVTAALLTSGLGTALVAVVALAVIVVGGDHVYSGVTAEFREHLRGLPPGRAGRATVVLGRAGYVAKGIALLVLGGLFGVAAVTSDAQEAGGLDAALRTLGEQPFGTALLLAVGLGFVAFGVYSIARSRYARS